MNPIYQNSDDTIAALATPGGASALSIIRISGKSAFDICGKIFRTSKTNDLSTLPPYSIHFGPVTDGDNVVDDVLVSIFKTPHSYTGEDVVEISCHGSVYIRQQVLQLLVRKGARMAAPGEFTMRAFLNKKIDLSQAEAIADLIASRSEVMHRIAIKQLRGGFSNEIKKLREDLIRFASLIELELDFSEEDVEFAKRDDLILLVLEVRAYVKRLADSFSIGNVIKNGIPVVIAGKTNVGKSTLLNVLLNDDKAIVSEIPGTTRDVIEDEITLGGIVFRFMDTAGIRSTRNAIEAMGVKKTLEKIKMSSVVLYVFDVHELTNRELKGILKEMQSELAGSRIRIIPVGNKIDKEDLPEIKKEFASFKDIVFISAREKTNIEQLTQKLLDSVNNHNAGSGDVIVTNVRQWEALVKAEESLQRVEEGLRNKTTGELIAADIRIALHQLSSITGQVSSEDLLTNIFSRFCIGK